MLMYVLFLKNRFEWIGADTGPYRVDVFQLKFAGDKRVNLSITFSVSIYFRMSRSLRYCIFYNKSINHVTALWQYTIKLLSTTVVVLH
jgi:hypothetical protein